MGMKYLLFLLLVSWIFLQNLKYQPFERALCLPDTGLKIQKSSLVYVNASSQGTNHMPPLTNM